MTGRDLIEQERNRQVGEEGWTQQHDDRHTRGELSAAAACYRYAEGPRDGAPTIWPWSAADWKPLHRGRNLARAGALFLAERDRIDRALRASENGSPEHRLLTAARDQVNDNYEETVAELESLMVAFTE